MDRTGNRGRADRGGQARCDIGSSFLERELGDCDEYADHRGHIAEFGVSRECPVEERQGRALVARVTSQTTECLFCGGGATAVAELAAERETLLRQSGRRFEVALRFRHLG